MEIGTIGTGIKIRSTIGSFEVPTMAERIEKVRQVAQGRVPFHGAQQR